MKKKVIVKIFHMEYNSVIISTVVGEVPIARGSLIYAFRK